MADGRFLSKGIAHSEQIASVSLRAQLLFMCCLPHLDVEGRMPGTPRTVKAIAVPLRDEMTVKIVESAIRELAEVRLIHWYLADGLEVIAYPNFRRHQKGLHTEREAPTKLPPYGGSDQDLLMTRSGLSPRKLSKGKGSEVKVSQEEVRDERPPRGPLSPVSGVTVAVPEAYQPQLDDLLSRVAEPRTWLIEMRAMLDGMPGHFNPSAEQLGRAIRDYLGNGAARNTSLRQFRRYVEGAIAENGHNSRTGKPNIAEQGYANAKAALEDIPG